MDAQKWDARYGQAELVWGIEANGFVVDELSALEPGRALDVACGEGRNAIWLAKRGWQVVGVDFSAQGLRRAGQLACRFGVVDRVDFRLVDVVGDALPAESFDAVIVAYLQLDAGARRAALRNAAAALAPGGTLLVVGHDTTNLTAGTGGPQDVAVLYSPQDVVNDLDGLPGLGVRKAQRVRRPVPGSERAAIDVLVRLQRRTREDENPQ